MVCHDEVMGSENEGNYKERQCNKDEKTSSILHFPKIFCLWFKKRSYK